MVPGPSHHRPSDPTHQAPPGHHLDLLPISDIMGYKYKGPVFLSLFSWTRPQTSMTPFPLPQPNFCVSAIVSTIVVLSLVKICIAKTFKSNEAKVVNH